MTQDTVESLRADPVNHPQHYTSQPSGVDCIQFTEHMGFNLGNAVKYIWRAEEMGIALEDLQKADWYVAREIERRSAVSTTAVAPTDRERELARERQAAAGWDG